MGGDGWYSAEPTIDQRSAAAGAAPPLEHRVPPSNTDRTDSERVRGDRRAAPDLLSREPPAQPLARFEPVREQFSSLSEPMRGVLAIVRRAHLAVRALRLGEAALWSVATFAATLAAVAHEGADAWQRDGFVLAGLAAAGVFAALVHSTLPRLADTARELDRRHGARFGLVAAFERALSGRANELDVLLAQRVLSRLPRGAGTAGHAATIAPAVAAPLVATALLALAIDIDPRQSADPGTLATEAADALARAVATDEALDATQRAQFAELVGDLRRVAREADDDPLAAERLAELERELAAQTARLDPRAALARVSEKAGMQLAAAQRRASEESEAKSSAGGAASDGSGDGSGASDGPSAGADGGAEVDPSTSPSAPAPTGAPLAVEPERAARRVAWLEPHERRLVDAWNTARRAAAERDGAGNRAGTDDGGD